MFNVKQGKRSLPRPQVKHHKHATLKKLAIALVITIIAACAYFQAAPNTNDAKERRKLEATIQQLSESKNSLETQSTQDKQKIDEINKKLEETEKQLQAKRSAQVAYAASIEQARVVRPTSGTCAEWMAQAGIAQTAATNKLILNESGCNPHAVNPSSGACGIPQAYPCGKIAHCGTDPVCQLKWMQTYVSDRYGSWDNALAAWYSRCGSPQGCWY